MANRSRDWFNQALRDPEQAQDSRQAGRHEWACFAAQQSAEKAVKALHLHLKQEAWGGHVIAQLLRALPAAMVVPQELIEKGRVPDNFYIPTRYANGHPSGSPFEHYGPLQSDRAIRYGCVSFHLEVFRKNGVGGVEHPPHHFFGTLSSHLKHTHPICP